MSGHDHAFSKRTSIGVFGTKLNNDTHGWYEMFGVSGPSGGANGATATGNSDDVRQFHIGPARNF